MAWKAPVLLPSSLPSEGLSLRGASRFFLGLAVRLGLAVGLRLEAGGPIFGLAVDVGLTGDLGVDAVDVVDADDFGFALVFAMEADFVFMNPASVG